MRIDLKTDLGSTAKSFGTGNEECNTFGQMIVIAVSSTFFIYWFISYGSQRLD